MVPTGKPIVKLNLPKPNKAKLMFNFIWGIIYPLLKRSAVFVAILFFALWLFNAVPARPLLFGFVAYVVYFFLIAYKKIKGLLPKKKGIQKR